MSCQYSFKMEVYNYIYIIYNYIYEVRNREQGQ